MLDASTRLACSGASRFARGSCSAVVALAARGPRRRRTSATYTSLRSFLLHRVDMTLDAGHPQVEARSSSTATRARGRAAKGRGRRRGSTGTRCGRSAAASSRRQFLVRRRRRRRRTCRRRSRSRPQPRGRTTSASRYFTVPAASGRRPLPRPRVGRAERPEPAAPRRRLARRVDATLHRLLVIELLVTAAVLAGDRRARSLARPHRACARSTRSSTTAAAIAAGDLSRRVERADEDTEVGRLGLALNAMLGQIESAFRAREASERKLRRFVADASHELRTPLAAVRAYAELFTRGAASRPADLERSMSGISRESERMSLLVEDLLLLARLDEGRPLERKPLELERGRQRRRRDGEDARPGAADLGRARPRARRGRPRAAAPGRGQPALERALAHPGRDARARQRLERERHRRDRGLRRGPRPDGRAGVARLRALLPDRRLTRARERRRRPGPLDRGRGRRGARRLRSARGPSPGRGATFRIRLPLAR